MPIEHMQPNADGTMTVTRIDITLMTDGDPFNPKYATVPAQAGLGLERVKELAFELFGGRHTHVTETTTTKRMRFLKP